MLQDENKLSKQQKRALTLMRQAIYDSQFKVQLYVHDHDESRQFEDSEICEHVDAREMMHGDPQNQIGLDSPKAEIATNRGDGMDVRQQRSTNQQDDPTVESEANFTTSTKAYSRTGSLKKKTLTLFSLVSALTHESLSLGIEPASFFRTYASYIASDFEEMRSPQNMMRKQQDHLQGQENNAIPFGIEGSRLFEVIMTNSCKPGNICEHEIIVSFSTYSYHKKGLSYALQLVNYQLLN